METELSKGVQMLDVNAPIPDLNAMVNEVLEDSKARVSGLDSYNGSSQLPSSGGLQQEHHLSMSERMQMAKEQKSGRSNEKKNPARGLNGAAKEIDQQKRSKKIVNSGIADSIKELEKSGMEVADLLASMGKESESPAKRSKTASLHAENLTGAHEEPR